MLVQNGTYTPRPTLRPHVHVPSVAHTNLQAWRSAPIVPRPPRTSPQMYLTSQKLCDILPDPMLLHTSCLRFMCTAGKLRHAASGCSMAERAGQPL